MKHINCSFTRAGASLLLTLSLCLTGCASKYGPQITKVNDYPQCYKPIADLRTDENSTAQTTAGGAVAGALLGALIGGLATGKAEGALIGAAAGGATGAVAGNVYGKSQERKRDQQYINTYVRQLNGESASMDRATAAAKVATRCYNEQFQRAVAAVKAGRMDKPEFTRRYGEIRSGLEETSRILTTTATEMANKDEEYQRVLAEETGQPAPAAQPVAATAGKRKPSAKPAASTPRAQSVAQSTAKWEQSRTDLQDTQRDVQAQMAEHERAVAALEG